MKKLSLCFCVLLALGSAASAGSLATTSKESANIVTTCPEWFGDNEWNLNLWGTYVFTDTDWRFDEYLGSDHAWGGGADLKYFFHRYFGIGIQGFAVNATRQTFNISLIHPPFSIPRHPDIEVNETGEDSRLAGAFLGTFTLRFPVHCSRFAPYIWGGGGVIFGGGEKDEIVHDFGLNFHTEHHGSSAEGIGQVGAGFEVRFTRHIGWTNDFSWNFVTRNNSDFGMARTGINFAF